MINFKKTELVNGQLIVIKQNNNPFVSEGELTIGSIGIFIEYAIGYKKYLPGLEPLKVLIEGKLVTIYRDEIDIL